MDRLLFRGIEIFVYWYPALMAMVWILGSIIFYRANERKGALPIEKLPFVSILMPAHNEGDILYDVVKEMTQLNYPSYEIIMINDGSSDNTGEVLKNICQQYDIVRVIDLKPNHGKANALYLGTIAAKGEILVCVDSDSYLDKNALRYMVSHFVNEHNGERVGAVTGNPRVRNRGSLLGKLQLCEYASIISLIKRTQRVLGKVMTVSGVCVAYRKRALMECGFWDRDMVTEDIAVTWKLEKKFWDVRYEPRALCWMLVPETVKGLWKQRKRWASGGLEVIFRHWDIFKSWKRRRLAPIFIEQVCSFFWSVCWLILTIILVIMEINGGHVFLDYLWKSQFLSFVCLMQFCVAIWLEQHYDKNILKSTWSVIWYPLVYWYVNVFITLSALVKALKPKKKLATWQSPDRGITQSNAPKQEFKYEKKNEVATASYDDIKVSRLIQAYAKNPEDADGSSNLIDGTIENPINDYRSTKHIETKTKQKRWKYIIEIVLTVLVWTYMFLYWAYMIYGIYCDKMGYAIHEFWIYTSSTIHQTEHFFFILFVATIIEFIVLRVWKEYNYRRFGGLRRRKFKPDVTAEELDEFFDLDPVLANQFHNDKYIEVFENPIPDGIGQGGKN